MHRYNMSGVDPVHPLSKFKNMTASLKAGNYSLAAQQVNATPWCTLSPTTCAATVAAFAGGCPNATTTA